MTADTLKQALEHHGAGRLTEAETLYRKILDIDPHHLDALHLLGVASHQLGKSETALDLINSALEIRPQFEQAHNSLGIVLKTMGETDKAAACFEKALNLQPGYVDAHYNLGNLYHELGHRQDAAACYRKVLGLAPNHVNASKNLAIVLQEMSDSKDAATSPEASLDADISQTYGLAVDHHHNGRIVEAAKLYRKVLETDGSHPASLHNLGVIVMGDGDPGQAVALFDKAIAAQPDYARAFASKGMALFQLGLMDDALEAFRQSLVLHPNDPQVLFNIGNVQKEMGDTDEAIANYREALRFAPEDFDTLNNLGALLLDQKHADDARGYFQTIVEMAPQSAEARHNLGSALIHLAVPEQAAACFNKALDLNPNYRDAHSSLIFVQDMILDIDQAEQQMERQRWDEKFIQPLKGQIRPPNNNRDPERLLRIGYVSADFRRHSACQGFAPLIFEHDHQNFDVICYDASPNHDGISQVLQAAATGWRDIRSLSDEQVADTIRNDGIDILVDLSGHTRDNRLTVFGYKPAPLQVTGIGHLASGLSSVDYRLTTTVITPPEEEHLYPEKPIYLDTYFGFTPPPSSPPVGSSPILENGVITYGFLGRPTKITDQALTMWARILGGVEGSRMLFKHERLDDPDHRQKMMDYFSERGIDAERLILLGSTDQNTHLLAHNRVDILLDAFPHGGGITALESLLMGVPILGVRDPDKASGRIIASINHPLGLDDWTAETLEDYYQIAVRWAAKPQELAALRQELRPRVSATFNRFRQAVETAYRKIWRKWCDGDNAP